MDNGIKIPDCPAEMTLRLIGDKWKVLIIRDLLTGTKRFNELMRSVNGITQKVEYTLTETGYSLKPIPDSMAAWGTAYKKNTGQMQTQKEP